MVARPSGMRQTASKKHTVMPARATPSISAPANPPAARVPDHGRVTTRRVAAAATKRIQIVGVAPISTIRGWE